MATQVAANGGDRPRGMSAEDKMMFKLGRPFEDTTTPQSTPPSSPDKTTELATPLRSISMPKPFKI